MLDFGLVKSKTGNVGSLRETLNKLKCRGVKKERE